MRGLTRDLEREDDETRGTDSISVGRSGGGSAAQPAARERNHSVQVTAAYDYSLRREAMQFRGHEYRLRGSEVDLMFEVGQFRVVALQDLREERYAKRKDTFAQDLRSLQEQGLVRRVQVPATLEGKRLAVVVLTNDGRGLLEDQARKRGAGMRGGFLYSGFVKPREALHDAMLYRMFRAEARRIQEQGGAVKYVVLDSELKSRAFSDMALLRQKHPDWTEGKIRATAAELHQLPMIKGHVVFPDVRVHYEDERGENSRVDLEFATEHYREPHIATRLEAGFKVYMPEAVLSGRVRGSFSESHVMERILAL